jgi:RNA polymerase sigma-70 factor (ECF subfamily)
MHPNPMKRIPLSQSISTQTRRESPQEERDDAHPDPFVEFYHKHMRQIYAFHLMRTGNVEDAQDLTSQTFLSALEGLRKQPALINNSPWLYGIAKHKLADHYRKRRSQMPLDGAEAYSHPDPSPEEVATTRIELDQVVKELRTLAPQQADALILRIFAELSAAEIGRMMGKSEAAVKMLAHRGIRNLQRRISLSLEVSK